eukprot:CAMPEP_0170493260 /NCGR_PEP_ID=MMETSP0208-20121228/13611_1 /TAXON_ID=197538 /ORGANISM="Strombidium inclinatum, Strain S3" /LENGTH=153 /DNA_ID=CAMNT_0010769159 /DNA_START=363 /DNA_END=824 /DNA_ORIENTATION=+
MPFSLLTLFKTRQEPLSEKDVRKLLCNLLEAVHFIHTAGLMHRDLKPANILVGHDLKVKLCDFGLAQRVDPDGHSDDVRTLLSHVQSRYYRAPEIILLEPHYDHKIDLWSLGCILGELLLRAEDYSIRENPTKVLFPGSSCYPLSPVSSTAGN